MSQSDDRPDRTIATLNMAVNRFGNGNRRIDRLRQLCYDCNLSDNDARQFGKLTKTSTWEKLLLAHGLEFEPRIEPLDTALSSQEPARQINLMDWLECQQLIALGLAAVIFALLFLSIFPNRTNPFKLLPQVRIIIEIGDKK